MFESDAIATTIIAYLSDIRVYIPKDETQQLACIQEYVVSSHSFPNGVLDIH